MLTRRSFIRRAAAVLAGAATISLAPFALVKKDRQVGHYRAFMDEESMKVRKVFWNGCDITMSCSEAHGGEGWARCYPGRVDSNGYIRLLERERHQQVTIHGRITFKFHDELQGSPRLRAIVDDAAFVSIIPPRPA